MRQIALVAGLVVAVSCGRGDGQPDGMVDHAHLDASGTVGATATDPGTPHLRRPRHTEGRDEPKLPPIDKDAYKEAMIEGEAALYSGRFEAARVAYLRAMELRPESMSGALGALRSLAIEGHAEARKGITQRVQRKIDRYMQRPETHGAASLLAARLAVALGNTGEALDSARLAVQHMPDLGVAWRVLGESAIAAELWGEAIESLQTAVALGLQAEAGTWARMAEALDEVGELEAAEDAARLSLSLTGEDDNAQRRRLNLLGVILKHRGLLDEAGDVLQHALLLGPDDPAVLHNLGSLYEKLGRPGAALEHYRRAVEEVAVPTTLWRLGRLLLKEDRPNQALKVFTRAAANLPRWSWPRSTRWLPAYEVGKLYARAQRYKAATGWFEDALREARSAVATREIVSWLAFVKTQSVTEAQR